MAEGEPDFSRLDSVADEFENISATLADWERWETTFGFSFPADYKAFNNRYPNAAISGKFGFLQPCPVREIPYNTEAFVILEMRETWEAYESSLRLWPEEMGFFPVLSPPRQDLTVGFRVLGGKIEENKIYAIDLALGEVEVFEGSFIDFMEEMVFEDHRDAESPIGGISFLMRDSYRNGNVIWEESWPERESFFRIYASLSEDEKKFIDRFQGLRGLGKKFNPE